MLGPAPHGSTYIFYRSVRDMPLQRPLADLFRTWNRSQMCCHCFVNASASPHESTARLRQNLMYTLPVLGLDTTAKPLQLSNASRGHVQNPVKSLKFAKHSAQLQLPQSWAETKEKQIQFILRTVQKHKSCTEMSSSSRTGLGPDQIDGPGPLPDPSQSIRSLLDLSSQ